MKPHDPRYFLMIVGVLSAAVACASAASDGARPSPTLAGSLAAQREFRSMQRSWLAASPSARPALEAKVVGFLRAHPEDARARIARIYLAWIRIEQGRLPEAQAMVRDALGGRAGSAQDLATVTRAAILTRQGQAARALVLLAPLDGKIVDLDERLVYGEELVHAALGAKRWRAALDYLLDWLVQAPLESRDAVEARVEELLGGVPSRSLEGGLAALDDEARRGVGSATRAGPRSWLRRVLRETLISRALDGGDPALAQRLIESGPASVRAGERGDALARLAARGQVVARVAGRSVGLLLSVTSAEERRRSASVAAGLTRALGLPESARRDEAVRLAVRDDGGDLEATDHALAALAGDGAAILVAGVTGASAERATRFAVARSIPVIVLAPSAPPPAGGFAFSLAAAPERAEEVLLAALRSAGAARVARVGSGGASCDAAPASAGAPRFPVSEWKRERIDALASFGAAGCTRDAVDELAAAGRRPLIGLGLESAELIASRSLTGPRLAVATGSFPWVPGAGAPAALEAFVEATGAPPNFFVALGYDAGMLAAAALATFPLEVADDAAAVAELHEQARARLATVRAPLWTSARPGFEGGRALERELHTVSAR
ncbi:MAG: hypothetical protein OZ921_18685 [Sorangiineae bacterium]|nr:hypothetical protein [Polyangiaceae bacterium]MEB2324549.1 hypothetical protein [Sorangiineae bacterium]